MADSVEELLEEVSQMEDFGYANLEAACRKEKVPNKPGIYKIFYQGKLMKIDLAKEGLRQKFIEYYQGNGEHIDQEIRGEIRVKWRICKPGQLSKVVDKMLQEAKEDGKDLPWQ